MASDIKLADLPMRYIVVFYGLYILGRCLTTFVDSDFARQMFTGEIQHATYGFNFAYISGTILHPIVFSYLVVEFGAKRIPTWFSLMVVSLHLLSVLVAFISTTEGSLGCVTSEFGGPSLSNCFEEFQYFSILLEAEIISSFIVLLIATIICLYSRVIISKNKLFFRGNLIDNSTQKSHDD